MRLMPVIALAMFAAAIASQTEGPHLGLALVELEEEAGRPRGIGVLICRHGFPSHEAGIRAGDIIEGIGPHRVATEAEYTEAFDAMRDQKMVVLKYRRPRMVNDKERWSTGRASVKLSPLRDQIESQLIDERDDVRGTKTTRHRDTNHEVNSQSELWLAVVETDGQAALMLRIQYVASEGLFMRELIIRPAGAAEAFTHSLGNNVKHDVNRDHASRRICEWATIPVDEKLLNVLQSVVNSHETTIRLVGRNYAKDRDLTDAERDRMFAVLEHYKATRNK